MNKEERINKKGMKAEFMKKQLKKVISVFLAAVLCCSVYTVTLQAAPVKGYMKSVTMKSKATIVIPADKEKITKSYEVTVKVKGTVSQKFTAKSSNKAVATVKVKGNKLLVTAKKAGKAKIIVTTKGKNKKGKQVKKTLALTVKKVAKPVVQDPKKQEKAKEATDMANIRAAVTEVMDAYNKDSQPHFKSVPVTQEQAGWQDEKCGILTTKINGEEKDCWILPHTKADGPYVVFVWKDKDGVRLDIVGGSEVEIVKERIDTANVRAAYEEVMAAYNTDFQTHSKTVPALQEQALWQDANSGQITTNINGEEKEYMILPHTKADGPYTVSVSKGTEGVILVIE